MRKSVCVISFSAVHRDARVLRQVRCLAKHYDVTVIGFGPCPSPLAGDKAVTWKEVALEGGPAISDQRTLAAKVRALAGRVRRRGLWRSATAMTIRWLFLRGFGRVFPSLYEWWYWTKEEAVDALAIARAARADLYLANDWNALPVAAKAARSAKARLVLDAHEYAPLEFENVPGWTRLYSPAVTHVLRKYSPRVDASMTVCQPIADRYRTEFGLDPIVVLSAPERIPITPGRTSREQIRLVHHGAAMPARKLDIMIHAIALCDQRFELHFVLVSGPEYIRELKETAERAAPGRVFFHEPVPPDQIVARLCEYDIGLCLIAPTSYNYLVALPNKLFDFISAGLAVCIGPSPAMAELVSRYGCGCVAPSFDAADVAATLNSLDAAKIAAMREAARRATTELNAQNEMKKVEGIARRILGD